MPLVVLYAAVYWAPAFTVTGVAKVTDCHPEVDSFVKVAVASCVPAALKSDPVCGPVFPDPL